jgi:hypothetical protein
VSRAWLGALIGLAAGLTVSCALGRNSQRELAKQTLGVLYYSDLGPASVDVSGYPQEQQKNYQVYSRVCSQCHTLARSNYCPVVSRSFWELYISAMRNRTYYYYEARTPMTPEDSKAILDFLDYDAKARKIDRMDEFDRQTKDLKLRFDAAIRERLKSQ